MLESTSAQDISQIVRNNSPPNQIEEFYSKALSLAKKCNKTIKI